MLIHCEIQKWIILDTRIFNKDIFLEFHVLRYYTIHCLPPSFFYFDHCSFFRSSLLSLCSNSQKRLFFRFLSPMRHRPTNGAPLNVPLTFHAFFSEHTVASYKTNNPRPAARGIWRRKRHWIWRCIQFRSFYFSRLLLGSPAWEWNSVEE